MRLFIFLSFLVFSTFLSAQSAVKPSAEYVKHLDAAKSHGVKFIKDLKDLDKYKNKGKLLKIKQRGYGWRVGNLTHSHAYLVKDGKTVVADIAREFVKQSGQNFFVITSLTRTLEDQNRLRKINSNASFNESSHNFGSAFDISYVRFNHKNEPNAKLDKTLEDILKSFEKRGKIYFVKEKKMKCFHIIVR